MPRDSDESRRPGWSAGRATAVGLATAWPAPDRIDHHWQPLGQAWRSAGPEAGFQPGWARVSWQESFLRFEALFMASAPGNRARRLNEHTWELGDVCEVFLQVPGDSEYVELHVTPENQRLQLRWPDGGLERVRRGEAPLADFLVDDPGWVESATASGRGYWAVQAVIPAPALGRSSFAAGTMLRAAVCRYDYDGRPEPILSSTAPLREPAYHRREDWQDLSLSAAVLPGDAPPGHA